MGLTESERESLFDCAARLGYADRQRDERTDQWVIMRVLDTFDPAGEIQGDLTPNDRSQILASYSSGQSALNY